MSSNEGWTWLMNSAKWHYFLADGRSLCGRWMTFTQDREQGKDTHPDNCKACMKKLAERKARETST